MTRKCLFFSLSAFLFGSAVFASVVEESEPFRPEEGKFPPIEKAHTYRGEIIFVDHPNRRGSIRVEGTGKFYRNDPHPFALLPYGIVRYHDGPADLRDIPLGTVMHAHGFLPPDPTTSSVPVLPPNNKDKDAGHYRGTGIFPAENHILLLEDEPSHCRRNGLIWKILEVEVRNDEGTIVAKRVLKTGDGDKDEPQTMTFDSATRIWQGRESIRVSDLISQKVWPESGKKEMKDQSVLLGITWKPAPGDGLSGAFTRFHISDIWLDDQSIEHAAYFQTQKNNHFIRTRWMPAYVTEVKYGKFGQATATLTLFGGMDQALYNDFKKDSGGQINGAENTLKHTASHYGPGHMASNGKIVQFTKQEGKVPLGSSGIQVDFKTDQIIEAIRPGRVVKIRPDSWPKSQIPREEYLFNNSPENRFPTPAIFPKY